MVEILKVLGTILAAMITTFGGGYFVLKKYLLEREDAKDAQIIQKQIDDSIAKVKEELKAEIAKQVEQSIKDCGDIGDKAIADAVQEARHDFEEGLRMRGEEGLKRFEANSKAIDENTAMIKQILTIQKNSTEKIDKMADSITALAQVSEACAESQRTANYDRLLIVTSKIIKSKRMTMTEKTNLIQLYDSWKKLQGNDKKIDVMYDECLKITPVLDEGA